jgi:Na+/H+ antiporter NhaC
MEHYGFLSLVPSISVLVFALLSRKTFESLVVGSVIGFIILSKTNFFGASIDSILRVMQDPIIGWIILVCGLFGALIHLLVKSGGSIAFADYLLRYIKNRKTALIVTWLLGLSIFIDDYLNALTVGSSMKKVTDKFGVPREMLAYIVDSTAAPICVIIPLSTWAIYLSGLLESTGVAASGEGLQTYLSIIPYIIYGWAAAIIVPLVALKIIPPLGAMKKAEIRVLNGGTLAPPKSESISLDVEPDNETIPPKLYHFILPIIVLIAATVYFDVDALKGVIVAVFFTVALYVVEKVMDFDGAIRNIFEGIKTMIYALAIITFSFVLKDVNEQLGLSNYILESVSPWMTKEILPAIAFLSLALITFATGSFWGVYAISFPIIVPLAQSFNVDLPLALGAVISAGAFGSHACFYGDATVLSSSASGCNNMAHVLSQLPYTIMAGLISFLLFLFLGYTI